jgi:hypothetical protein
MNLISEKATFNRGRIKADVDLEMVKLEVAYNFWFLV